MDGMIKTNIGRLLKSLLISYVITMIFLLVMAFGMYKFQLSESLVNIGIMLTYGVSNLIGGRLFAKKIGMKRIIAGIVLSIAYILVLIIVSLAINKGSINSVNNLIRAIAISMIGGIMGGFLSPVSE